VRELYHIGDASPLWAELRASDRPLVVVTGLHSRPVEWLLRHHGLGAAGLRVLSKMDVTDPEEFVGQLATAFGEVEGAAPPPSAGAATGPDRWYPIHDKSRCTECQHCLQFCLFGVYELDAAGKVRVTNPDNCKAGCPACARVCPHSAIMFPLYARDPAIAGAPGQFVALDAEGRKLYYGRTGAPCPTCGQSGETSRRKHNGDSCSECGRPLSPAEPAVPAPSPEGARDELDGLLDELEELSGGAR
jgi:Pyruvate/2-oxoacid:ferredoxin oxidoreductase delta subunit